MRKFLLVFAAMSVLFAISSCKKDADEKGIPELTTTTVSDITASLAVSGGTITDAGESNITVSGICWSTSPNPTTANFKTTNGSTVGSFTSSMTGLGLNTTYYVRAYATNSDGTGYGNEVSFTTKAGTSSMDADIDGSWMVALTISIVQSGSNLSISGQNGTRTLILWLPTTPTTGSHALSMFGTYKAQYSNGSTIYTSDSGTINITTYTPSTGRIKGTFSFLGSNFSTTVNVTAGNFEVYI